MKSQKAKRGTCSVNASQGKLRIRLPRCVANGEQFFLYTGLPDSQLNHKKVLAIALTIEADIESQRFDTSLERYRTAIRELSAKQTIQIAKKNPTLIELWDKYAISREKQVSKASFHNDFLGRYPRMIRLLPSQEITDAPMIREFLLETRTADAAKRLLVQFNACCRWALRNKLIESNPFDGLASEIRVPKYSWKNIDPFSMLERDFIIKAFDLQRPEYADFVRFLFWSGCRLGEAAALQWKDVNGDCSEIYFSQTINRNFGRKGTKTNESRRFPCNQQVKEMLTRLQPITPTPLGVVFPSNRGEEIKLDNFLRVWHGKHSRGEFTPGIVQKLANDGIINRYRSPYNCRHSFISSCLQSGIPVAQVSHWCGNSVETIHQHYSGVISDFKVPNF